MTYIVQSIEEDLVILEDGTTDLLCVPIDLFPPDVCAGATVSIEIKLVPKEVV